MVGGVGGVGACVGGFFWCIAFNRHQMATSTRRPQIPATVSVFSGSSRLGFFFLSMGSLVFTKGDGGDGGSNGGGGGGLIGGGGEGDGGEGGNGDGGGGRVCRVRLEYALNSGGRVGDGGGRDGGGDGGDGGDSVQTSALSPSR